MIVEKVYKVTFMEYTDVTSVTVCLGGNKSDPTDRVYLKLGTEPCLIKESDLELFRAYGGGFRDIIFVGNLYIPERNITVSNEGARVTMFNEISEKKGDM